MSMQVGRGASYIPEFKAKVDKSETTALINKIKEPDATTGTVTITKDDFKALANQFKGGKEDLAELFNGISPKEDVDKLKAFTFSRDGQSTKIELTGTQKDQFVAKLNTLLTNSNSQKETMDSSVTKLANKLSTFTGQPGEITERTTVLKLGVSLSASLGSPAAKDTDAEVPLGLANTDGLAAEVGLEGSVGFKATAKTIDGGKVQLSYEFQALGEAKGKVAGFKVANHEGNFEAAVSVGAKKTVTYTFANKEEALAFINDKGRGFKVGDTTATGKTYTVEKTGFQMVTGKSTLTSSVSKVQKTSEVSPGWYSSVKNFVGNIFGFRSIQNSSFKKEKVGDESTKTFTLDTMSKFAMFEKKTTSTSLTLTKTKDKTTGTESFSGAFSMDINIEKIKNNKDRDGLINKLVGRFNEVSAKFEGNSSGKKVGLDKEGIRAYITHSVDKLLHAGGLFTADGSGKLQVTASGQKVKEKSVDQFKMEGAIGIGSEISGMGVGVSAELKITKSKMVRINLPLEMDGGKLKPKDSDARVQLSEFNLIGAGIGAELELGSESVVGAKVAVKVGGEKGSTSMRDVFAATNTATTDTSVGGLPTFNAKKSEASDKNGEAIGSKDSAKTLFTDFKKLTVEAKTLESKIKSIESKIAAINSYTGPSFLKPTLSFSEATSVDSLKEQMKGKLESAQEKLSEAKTKIGEAKTSVTEAKSKIGEAFTGIKGLHDKASQHKDLRSSLIDTQSKSAGIDQNIKEIDKLAKEIDFAML